MTLCRKIGSAITVCGVIVVAGLAAVIATATPEPRELDVRHGAWPGASFESAIWQKPAEGAHGSAEPYWGLTESVFMPAFGGDGGAVGKVYAVMAGPPAAPRAVFDEIAVDATRTSGEAELAAADDAAFYAAVARTVIVVVLTIIAGGIVGVALGGVHPIPRMSGVMGGIAADRLVAASVGEISAQVASPAQVAGNAVAASAVGPGTIDRLSTAEEQVRYVTHLIDGGAGQTYLQSLSATTLEAARAAQGVKAADPSAVPDGIVRNMTRTSTAAQEVAERIARVAEEADAPGASAADANRLFAEAAASIAGLSDTLIPPAQASNKDADRRHYPRYAIDRPARVVLHRWTSELVAENWSEGGARLAGDVPDARVGAMVQVSIDGLGTRLPAKVVAIRDRGIHLQFELDTDAATQFGRQFRRAVAGKTPLSRAA